MGAGERIGKAVTTGKSCSSEELQELKTMEKNARAIRCGDRQGKLDRTAAFVALQKRRGDIATKSGVKGRGGVHSDGRILQAP